MPLCSRDDGSHFWGWPCCRHVLAAMVEKRWQRDTWLLSLSGTPHFVCTDCEPETRTRDPDVYMNDDEAFEDQDVIMATYDATHPGEQLFGMVEKWVADGRKPLRLP